MPLIWDHQPRAKAVLCCAPTRRGVISWNTTAGSGSLAVRVRFADESWSSLLPYVRWSPKHRLSLGGTDPRARFEVDLLMTTEPFAAIELHPHGKLDEAMLATPVEHETSDGRLEQIELDVPKISQYVGDPGRGWCSPASLAMILRVHGVDADVGTTARDTYDEAYHGTGNWAFSVAYASRFGLRAFVAYLRGLAHAREFLAAGLPLALSFSWKEGELQDPPLPSSEGHVAVLRGFDKEGNPILNDPAQYVVRVTYPREQFERLWLAHGGIAYVIGPPDSRTIELANR